MAKRSNLSAAKRPEAGGDPVTPYEVYVSGQAIRIPKWQG